MKKVDRNLNLENNLPLSVVVLMCRIMHQNTTNSIDFD